ncbi:RNA-directed DNA polymerase [Treponema sp. OMZ 788]|uniref:RNA-directed DNA polymerase n=2 Tax=Treponema TaxID=157 RepID=UPI0020A2A35A|nr:RNA-directed DNA polymerase [Treponema sp. OMZ 788]UTC65553.1 RNA-directed DNA polymerase [Treponema sp. OMZ 788]
MEIHEAINLAIDNIIIEGLNDIYPNVFEVSLLKDINFREKIIEATIHKIKKSTITEMDFQPLQYSYFPKKEAFDFRKAASIQPWDLIKYMSLVLLCAEEIESKRPAKDKNIVFSYRFYPKDGRLFDTNYDYKAFQKNLSDKIKEKRYKIYIKADIANYYDRLNLHRLENILLSYCSNKTIVKLINQLLLFWSNRDSYGLPVGSNPSRILAEAELIEVDNYLLSKKIDFIRFVDDYRIFANDAKEAHYYLNLFIARLSLEGLSVNTGKTSIEKTKEYQGETKTVSTIEVIDTSHVKKNKGENPTRLIVGYSGLIPTKYRQPTQSEISMYQTMEVTEIKSKIAGEEIIKPEIIRDFVKYIAINNAWKLLDTLLDIMDKFPQFIPYICDMIIKKQNTLSENAKHKIKDKFLSIIQSSKSYPEYIYLSAVTILTEKQFLSKNEVLNFYRDLRRSTGAFIGRYTIDRLEKFLTRGEILEIRNEFHQVGLWEKRSIIKISKEKLDEEESRPWLKNIKSSIKIDPFSEFLL